MERKIAEESLKTKKARAKLQKKLEEIEERVTQQALEKTSTEIHRWISRHSPSRVVLKNKAIALFDENRNTAEISQKISNIAQSLMCPVLHD